MTEVNAGDMTIGVLQSILPWNNGYNYKQTTKFTEYISLHSELQILTYSYYAFAKGTQLGGSEIPYLVSNSSRYHKVLNN